MRFQTIILIISFFSTLLLSSKTPVFSASLNWTKSNGDINLGVNQEIRISPSDKNVVYATVRSTMQQGLIKSTNYGESFNTIFNTSLPDDFNSIAISRTNPNRIWISANLLGVWDYNPLTDTWTPHSLPAEMRFLAIDPNNDAILYAGTNGGIYKSVDYGNIWFHIGDSSYGYQHNLAITVDPLNSKRIFAGSDGSLYRSEDSGDNWVPLPVNQVNLPTIVIDSSNPKVIYAASWGLQQIYRSENNGDTWTPLTNSPRGLIFRQTQDNHILYASRREGNGRVFRSRDCGENWEDIAPAYWVNAGDGDSKTWGLDVRDGRIIVGVQDRGIFWADDPDGPLPCPGIDPPPAPLNVVIPGIGASWSFKGLILKDTNTTYDDWSLVPKFTDSFYQPLITALGPETKVFAYDYRKPVSELGNWLYDFLTENLAAGQKANIAAHSLGGLITRACYEDKTDCAAKINKIVTAGTPHQGALPAYNLWEAGEITGDDLLMRYGTHLLLHVMGFPKVNPKNIVQDNIKSVRDFLPAYNNYLVDKDISEIVEGNRNIFLPELNAEIPTELISVLTTFSGNKPRTPEFYEIKTPNKIEALAGWWADGKPSKTLFAPGDKTTLASSSRLAAAPDFQYGIGHSNYFGSAEPIAKILSIIGLPSTTITTIPEPKSLLLIYTPNDLELSAESQTGKALFITDFSKKTVTISIKSNYTGDYEINSIFTNSDLRQFAKKMTEKILKDQEQKILVDPESVELSTSSM